MHFTFEILVNFKLINVAIYIIGALYLTSNFVSMLVIYLHTKFYTPLYKENNYCKIIQLI
jgi:hypothetical protein